MRLEERGQVTIKSYGRVVLGHELHELEKIPSRITQAYEPMNLGVHAVTGQPVTPHELVVIMVQLWTGQ